MVRLRPCLWQIPLLLCLGGLFQWDVCRGQRLVQIQEGPLYRVRGYPITISCSVSGFKGPDQQQFEFSSYKPAKPNLEIKIISTAEENHGYAVYSTRVRSRDITIERQTGSSVLLQIKPLLIEDTAVYECYTPNTDGQYLGIYSAKTTLNVIEDTLVASFSGPPSQSLSEGDTLQLECQVSSQTFQHTHLSVTWLLHGDSDAQPHPIITLDRDLTVKPGLGFKERYRSGLIGMEKVEETTYRLRIAQLQGSDRGRIYCQAHEWIQDPDRSWISIAHKVAKASTVEVKSLEVAADVGSFLARIKALKGDLLEGEAVEIRCSVEAQNLPGHFFSVAWLKDDHEVAQIGPSGVLTVGPDYRGRASEGELRAVKTTDKDYLLTIQPVRTEDQGRYLCRVWQEERSEAGAFTRGQNQQSSDEVVSITAKESGLVVAMPTKEVEVEEGVPLQVICTVSVTHSQLSVTWQHKRAVGSSFSDVISLSREGVMVDTGAQYQQRGVRTFRSTADNFTLEISEVTPSDSGDYKCTVSEWSKETNGNVKKTSSQSQECNVKVNSVDSLLRVDLMSRTVNVDMNDEIELLCRVRGPKVPLSVKWRFQPKDAPAQEEIVSMLHTGDIFWTGEQRNYQLRIQVQPTGTTFVLRVARASSREAGSYQCATEAFLQQIQRSSKLSNKLGVYVREPVSKLSLSSKTASPLEVSINMDVQMECSVTMATSNSSRFMVTWQAGDRTVATMDRDAVVTIGQEAGPGAEQRISMRQSKGRTFQLAIRQAGAGDSGWYHCVVEEWLLDPHGDWYSLQPKNVTMELVISVKPTDFTMDMTDVHKKAREGEQLDLQCSLGAGMDSTSHYGLTWLFESPGSSSSVSLLSYNYDGRLQYLGNQELKDRLHFSRPSVDNFHLDILNSIPADSGRYFCRVDLYKLDCKGKWEQRATSQSGSTSVTVNQIESNLRVEKLDHNLSVSDFQTGFTVDCIITSQSSANSVFEVTWSRRQGADKERRPQTIFNASRDGTLETVEGARGGLVFGRPEVTRYTLTVPNVGPADSGLYHCQVVEWLLEPTHTWRKLAEDKSGEITVHVYNSKDSSGGGGGGGTDSRDTCSSGKILGTFIPLLCFLVVVVIALVLKMQKTKGALKRSGSRKQAGTLWAEDNPLKPSPVNGAEES